MSQRPYRRLPFRFASLRRAEFARDVRHELDFHLEQRTAALIAAGHDPVQARALAEQEFGDLSGTAAYCAAQDIAEDRQARVIRWFFDFGADMRHAMRSFRKHRAFPVLSATTLALGLAAALVLTTTIHQLLLSPFPFPGGDRIVWIWTHAANTPDIRTLPGSDAADLWSDRARSLDAVEQIEPSGRAILDDKGELSTISTAGIDETFFRFLHVPVAFGRGIVAADRVAGAPPVAVIGYDLWQDHFHRAPDIVGRVIRLRATSVQIVGVANPALRGVPGLAGTTIGAWLPLSRSVLPRPRIVMARLRTGAAMSAAEHELSSLLRLTIRSKATAQDASVVGAREMFGATEARALMILWWATGLLLLVAVVNYMHLLLARTAERTREFAIRKALGASGARLFRQNIAEALLIGMAAFVLQFPASQFLLQAGRSVRPEQFAAIDRVHADPLVLFWGAMAVIGLTTVCAVATTFAATRTRFTALRGGAATAARPVQRARRLLVVVEVALAFMLTAGAVLLGRSFISLVRQPLGFDLHREVMIAVSLPRSGADSSSAARRAKWDALEQLIDHQPGVTGVIRGLGMPPVAGIETDPIQIDGLTNASEPVSAASGSYVQQGFFALSGIRLLQGTDFPVHVEAGADLPVIVNRSMARHFWPDGHAIGAVIRMRRQQYHVIGVVDDVASQGLHSGAAQWHLYHPLAEFDGAPDFLVRVTGAPSAAAPVLASIVRRAGLGVVVESSLAVNDMLATTVRSDRFYALVLSAVALFGGLLTIIGVFGVVVSVALQRTREIALRLALGSTRGRIYRIIVGDGMRPVAIGLVMGALGAALVARSIGLILYGVSSTDPVTFVAAGALVLVATLVATVVPAARAAGIDPATALRADA